MTAYQGKPAVHWKSASISSWPFAVVQFLELAGFELCSAVIRRSQAALNLTTTKTSIALRTSHQERAATRFKSSRICMCLITAPAFQSHKEDSGYEMHGTWS